ncbi:MAG: DtxR family transcriptional regulator [Gemmatimonadetes bacterium]|nr:DtxR family transcriptional regulator [Gemmatimonadota bacterium]|tara:strand:+ start:1825 stop:2502 length:678 start_codon:yes stop_codon:yes gene_type:complete
MLSQAAQDYIKSIYKLQNGHEPVESVNTSLIAEKMEVAAASATNMVKKLAELNLLQHTPYRGVELTEAGREVALEILRHHRLIELYLSKALGYRWDEVDAEADRLEHVISEEFEDKIDEVLGFPTTDPHGAPIPTKEGDIERFDYQRLTDVTEGKSVVIGQVNDQDPEMLRYMASLGLRPGVEIEVRKKAPFNGPIEIQLSGGERQALGVEVAGHIFVTLSDDAL